MWTFDQLIDRRSVMAVLTVDDPFRAADLARAMVAGGCPLLEVTLRTPGALAAISAMAGVPGALVGAGTVLNADDYAAAVDAGAGYAVSPGATPALLAAGAKGPIPLLPGAATASDIMAGLAAGYTRFKFFPAEASGGAPALRAFFGPFPQVRFCPTGGVSVANAPGYLSLPNVMCVGGSWIAPPADVAAGRWGEITARAQAAAALRAGA